MWSDKASFEYCVRDNMQKKQQTCLHATRTISNLVLCCDHDKHRSAGVLAMASMSMGLACNGWHVKDLQPLMNLHWSDKTCPDIDCAECLEDNDTNQKCYKGALERLNQEVHDAIHQ